ncbi:hypothetical protein H1V43_38955 [Streptomyces sp. PSKA54]|uniref:Uncharacterized protein n=1 Tax=Streptomyces himalayensis subsp. aureolus TaxID=2758039 RepID=A0A7W2D9U4_9ACTN|nr:hypothetical protein [Streptomyces himalayensis]MBA4867160.1 hypothetical protein [Streptomyces himalayensis subsp. aureolus]
MPGVEGQEIDPLWLPFGKCLDGRDRPARQCGHDRFSCDAFVRDAFVRDAFVCDAFVCDAFVRDVFIRDA